jgi:Domain of unknown function (DUF5659)
MHTEYKTPDIVLAAYLKLSGCAMARIEKQGQKGTFVFDDVSEEVIRTFDFGKAQVEPVSFNNMIKQLTTSVRRMD